MLCQYTAHTHKLNASYVKEPIKAISCLLDCSIIDETKKEILEKKKHQTNTSKLRSKSFHINRKQPGQTPTLQPGSVKNRYILPRTSNRIVNSTNVSIISHISASNDIVCCVSIVLWKGRHQKSTEHLLRSTNKTLVAYIWMSQKYVACCQHSEKKTCNCKVNIFL